MGIYFINKGRKTTSRASMYYCNNICGPGQRPNIRWHTTINTNRPSVSSRVATFVDSTRSARGGKPTWLLSSDKSRFGLANPPDYNPEEYLNQYGRLVGTGGQPLRNF